MLSKLFLANKSESGKQAEQYTNSITQLLGLFISKERTGSYNAKNSFKFESIDFSVKKRKGMTLNSMAKELDTLLRIREWFVTGNVDPSLFSDSFEFKDPDVTLKGIESYARGVNKLFNQKKSRAEIISTDIDTTINTIKVTWRLEGAVNIGPGISIKPYVVYTDFRFDPKEKLIVYQEDKFSIPGYDILLSGLFPFLRPFLAPEAPKIEDLRRNKK
jgi:hypothetical protein